MTRPFLAPSPFDNQTTRLRLAPSAIAEKKQRLATLERRQIARYDALRDLQTLIDERQLEIDNLRAQIK
jgi:hypothetical protein